MIGQPTQGYYQPTQPGYNPQKIGEQVPYNYQPVAQQYGPPPGQGYGPPPGQGYGPPPGQSYGPPPIPGQGYGAPPPPPGQRKLYYIKIHIISLNFNFLLLATAWMQRPQPLAGILFKLSRNKIF